MRLYIVRELNVSSFFITHRLLHKFSSVLNRIIIIYIAGACDALTFVIYNFAWAATVSECPFFIFYCRGILNVLTAPSSLSYLSDTAMHSINYRKMKGRAIFKFHLYFVFNFISHVTPCYCSPHGSFIKIHTINAVKRTRSACSEDRRHATDLLCVIEKTHGCKLQDLDPTCRLRQQLG